MDLKMNKQMEKSILDRSDKEFIIKVSNMESLLKPDLIKVYDCIIISKEPVDLTEEQYNKVIKLHNDKSGYEASCTETSINYLFENDDLKLEDILSTAFIVLEIWAMKLKSMEAESNFCLILSCNENDVTLRFHKVREDEPLWLAEDLEQYEQPVAYAII